MKNIVIIPASAIEETFGGTLPGIYHDLIGEPVIIRTLKAFENSKQVHSIVVSADEQWKDYLIEKIKENKITKISGIVDSGENRRESVFNALQTDAARTADNILTHDPDRPFVSQTLIENIIRNLEKYGAVVPATAIDCCIKESDENGFAIKTYFNKKLFMPQTPQGFRKKILKDSYEFAMDEMSTFGDDSLFVELNKSNPKQLEKYEIKFIQGEEANIKIKSRYDLKIAELILKERLISFI